MAKEIDLGLVDAQGYVLTDNDVDDIAQKANDDIVSEVKAELDARNEYEGYDDILGLQVDYENNICTRLAGAKGLQAGEDFNSFSMYSNISRCNMNFNGTVTACYGDKDYQDNGNKNLMIMVRVPKFYYKVIPLKLEKTDDQQSYHIYKANYFISANPYPGFKLHPAFFDEYGKDVDCFFYSAYEGSLMVTYDNGSQGIVNDASFYGSVNSLKSSLRSISGVKPISGQNILLTKSIAETWANHIGLGWHIETVKAHSALQFLMMIEYGTMNMQKVLGNGIMNTVAWDVAYNNSVNTGATKALGNISGEAVSNYGTDYKSVSYRGIENPYGNMPSLMLDAEVTTENDLFSVSIDNGYDSSEYKPVSVYIPTTNLIYSYIRYMGYDGQFDWLFLPSSHGEGKRDGVVGDSFDTGGSDNILLTGGSFFSKYGTGMFWGSTYAGKGTKGCRLIYLPQN